MPILVIPLVFLLIAAVVVLLIPFGVIQRYRSGTARRLARPWLAAFNAGALAVSTAFFFSGAAIVGIWETRALPAAALGLGIGAFLGLAGLLLTRWETRGANLFYTPNRWLVLAITVAVAGRIALTIGRGAAAWQTRGDAPSWLTEAGIAGSLTAGASVLTYYVVFWLGVWLRARRHAFASRRTWNDST